MNPYQPQNKKHIVALIECLLFATLVIAQVVFLFGAAFVFFVMGYDILFQGGP